jgi:hypothetical protein
MATDVSDKPSFPCWRVIIFRAVWPVKMEKIGYPETSVSPYATWHLRRTKASRTSGWLIYQLCWATLLSQWTKRKHRQMERLYTMITAGKGGRHGEKRVLLGRGWWKCVWILSLTQQCAADRVFCYVRVVCRLHAVFPTDVGKRFLWNFTKSLAENTASHLGRYSP